METLLKELRDSQERAESMAEGRNRYKAERQSLKEKLLEYSRHEENQLQEIEAYRQRLQDLETAVQQKDLLKLK